MNRNNFTEVYRHMSTNCFAIDGRFWVFAYKSFNINGNVVMYARKKMPVVPHMGNYIGVRG